jgi:hypothetical protein
MSFRFSYPSDFRFPKFYLTSFLVRFSFCSEVTLLFEYVPVHYRMLTCWGDIMYFPIIIY